MFERLDFRLKAEATYTHQITYDSFTIIDWCGYARDRSFAL
jgi:hypothetical protein